MTSHFADIGFWTTDSPSGAALAPAGGQGFAMSNDEMQAMLKQAVQLRQTIQDQLGTAHTLSQAVSPADEPASNAAVHGRNGVNETGRYYEGHLQYQFNYLSELITRLNRALGIVDASDQQAADGVKKTYGALG